MSNRKGIKLTYDDRARTRQVTHGPPALSTKTKSQWDGVSLECFSSSSSVATKVTPLRKNRIYETPKKTYGEANYSNQGIIDLSKSSSSEEFNDVKVSSMTTSASSKRKGNGWASLGSSQFKKIKNEDKANKQVNLTTVNSYSGWKDLVLKDTI